MGGKIGTMIYQTLPSSGVFSLWDDG
ncbi:uncharacterized protein METZ01_LOCUS380670 [marine metagenome]|uniref:Uncharacterized protein n=1 Tax=marine metagenome TaxID=408172 RepID=A0A382U0G3_9ZZZZ